MINQLFHDSNFKDKNILVLGSPRSGTHALASVILQQDPTLKYLREIGMHQFNPEPWKDFDLFCDTNPRKLGHIVQRYSKIFSIDKTPQIKDHTIIVSLRRRDKVKQFASWMYFKHIGAIYNFQHNDQDYLPPQSLTASMNDIEDFIFDQIIDNAFSPDYTFYYEDLQLTNSQIKKNQYVYPIEHIFSNLDLVTKYLGTWKYHD